MGGSLVPETDSFIPPRLDRPAVAAWKWRLFLGLGLLAVVAVFLLPPLPQDPAYHRFADRRAVLGVPHFWNVVSNLPFVLVGAAGLWLLPRQGGLFLTAPEKWPFLVTFLGVLLTGFGSAYYHLGPDDARLVWDRLPMAVAFMGLFAGVLGERVNPRLGVWLLAPLVLLGGGTVVYWYLGERAGAGNLWPYVVVQFYPLVAIPLLVLLFPARYTRGGDYFVALGWYVAAKLLELSDPLLYSLSGRVSGHPLKHVAAALGAFWVLRMLLLRQPLPRAGRVPRLDGRPL